MMHSPPHVGEFVREVIAEQGLNISSGARVLGVTGMTVLNRVIGLIIGAIAALMWDGVAAGITRGERRWQRSTS